MSQELIGRNSTWLPDPSHSIAQAFSAGNDSAQDLTGQLHHSVTQFDEHTDPSRKGRTFIAAANRLRSLESRGYRRNGRE